MKKEDHVMPQFFEKSSIPPFERQALIKNFPCFASLPEEQTKELVSLMREIHYAPHEKIVVENEWVDSVFVIDSGEAEVARESKHRRKIVQVPVATLHSGEAIGLNDTGFYSTTGKRTATVTALTGMLLLRLDIKDLYQFLQQHHLESAMSAASLQMLRVQFIKQSLPFSRLSHERLQWLAEHVEDMTVPAGTVIFRQGEPGENCYLIRSGQVEILTRNEKEEERKLALLKPPVLFGEATLIMHEPRNATARAVEHCELLILPHQYLSELLETEANVARMFMTLMVDRSRPIRNSRVTVHYRTTADEQEITILKNSDNGSYFKLSEEGIFIWKQLDGKHTLQDITLILAEQFHVFAPDAVTALISKLTKSGFIANLELDEAVNLSTQPVWIKAMVFLQQILEARVAFGDADQWITKLYNKGVYLLFSKKAQIVLAVLAVAGFITFFFTTNTVIDFFQAKHASLTLLLGLIPLSVIVVTFHEFAHAFAAKAFGREVHYIGVGWYWLTPIAFTDTSDMWLTTRGPRMLVNLAGVYANILLAGIAALLILLISNPYIQGMLWLFALYTYIVAFRALSPLQESDGYYVLMDWMDKPRLRQSAVLWLVKKFLKALRQPQLFRDHLPEISYWLACIIFLVLVSLLTLLVQDFLFKIVGIQIGNPYVILILPLFVVVFSSLSIIAEIRSQAEE